MLLETTLGSSGSKRNEENRSKGVSVYEFIELVVTVIVADMLTCKVVSENFPKVFRVVVEERYGRMRGSLNS